VVSIVTTRRLDDAATGTATGTVNEPTVATSGRRILVTGNWFASRSTDGGATWSQLSPFTEFPEDRGPFCCDQIAHYVRSHRLWVWLLQYVAVGPSNVYRLAVSATGASGTWDTWDIAPTDLDPTWTDVWLDYPDLAVSDGHLWVSCNVFDASDRWRAAAVVRLRLDNLVARTALAPEVWTTRSAGSLRFIQGAGDTMWFASTSAGSARLRVFAWPDAAATVSSWSVPVSAWTASGYSSRGPGGAEWLSRADWRVTAAWRSRGQLGFAWTAGPRTGRPHPYVKVVRLDEATVTLHDEPDLWSQTGAWAYPAAAPNGRGDVGIAAFFGGPTHPAHAVGMLDETTATWSMALTATSTHGPAQASWGDYLVVRPHPRSTTRWMASGFTLQGGTDRRFVEPLVVEFGP
jgi:hypothetical protein